MGVVETWIVLALWWVLAALFWVGIPVGIFVFARRFLRAFERRSVREGELAALTERLQRLEGQLEDLDVENDRLRDEQRFLRQLLAKRPSDASDSTTQPA